MIDIFHFMDEFKDGLTNAKTGLGAAAPKAFFAMGLDNANSSFVFRDDLHRAAFGGGVGVSREVKALGARAGGTNDAALAAMLKDDAKGLDWLDKHVLHVAATDILGYLEKLRRFLQHEQSLLRSSTGVSA